MVQFGHIAMLCNKASETLEGNRVSFIRFQCYGNKHLKISVYPCDCGIVLWQVTRCFGRYGDLLNYKTWPMRDLG